MKIYETMLPHGTKVRFEYEEENYSLVKIYVDDEFWGTPQGSIFVKQLLIDLEKNKKDNN